MQPGSLSDRERIQRGLVNLAKNTDALWRPGTVSRRALHSLSELEFLRDFVAASQPLVVTDLDVADWPCLDHWTDGYLLEQVGHATVSVNVTPDGLGDFVDALGRFVRPLEERLLFSEFWYWLQRGGELSENRGVPYLSRQNDSLRDELPQLLKDVPSAVPLGVAAFGNEPEAVNLWIGDDRAVSTCHKDHYENLYTVVRGEKLFTLLPPSAAPFLHEQVCRSSQFARTDDGRLQTVEDTPVTEVPWIAVDVADPDFVLFPDARYAKAIQVTVGPGEMLYLPAMWYHRVAQRGVTIAVNYWHDMRFGHLYIHNQFVRDIAGLGTTENSDPEDSEDA